MSAESLRRFVGLGSRRKTQDVNASTVANAAEQVNCAWANKYTLAS